MTYELILTILLGLACIFYASRTECVCLKYSEEPPRWIHLVGGFGAGLILAVLLFGMIPAHADDWSTGDTKREVAFQTLWAVDFLQTRTIVDDPIRWHEENNFLGLHPAIGAVNRYFLVGSVLHTGIAYLLPEKYRAPFQYVSIGVEGGYVAHNFSIGISARF
jgi:hypothetical protein